MRSPLAFGCTRCHELGVCGGLHARSGAFDCRAYCCRRPANCDVVCENNPDFADRIREVGGLELDAVPRATALDFPDLPNSVPLVFHGNRRVTPFAPPFIALSLYQLINRTDGEPRFGSHAALCDWFRIAPTSKIILSGTDVDRPLERWWKLGEGRVGIVRKLIELGAIAATSPNYSVFSNLPRWDNLHSMKRIAIVWEDMTRAGMPTALHVNARATRDWDRWMDFVGSRPEVTAVAYEFGTGAGGRICWHAEQLCRFALTVGRPLTLVVRGGLSVLAELAQAFAHVAFIDTTSAMKTVKRRRAVINPAGQLRWANAPTPPELALDDLLEHNYLTFARTIGAAGAGSSADLTAIRKPLPLAR